MRMPQRIAVGARSRLMAPRTRIPRYELLIGLDVGSTTVKAVRRRPDHRRDPVAGLPAPRHQAAREGPGVPEAHGVGLRRFDRRNASGSSSPAPAATGLPTRIGAKFVQEVNAVCLAVEKLYPQCGSVIELGGQDAKIIIFKEDPETGRKKKLPSMNDKCAGGTGAVIDKINAKLQIPADQLCGHGLHRPQAPSGRRASAASSPRPTSTACRRWACPRTS